MKINILPYYLQLVSLIVKGYNKKTPRKINHGVFCV